MSLGAMQQQQYMQMQNMQGMQMQNMQGQQQNMQMNMGMNNNMNNMNNNMMRGQQQGNNQQFQMPSPQMQFGSPQMQGRGQNQSQGQQPVIEENLSEPKIILKPELGGGLAVSLVFRYGVQGVAYMGAHCAYLIIKNTKDFPIRY
jgi:hypothetical protein